MLKGQKMSKQGRMNIKFGKARAKIEKLQEQNGSSDIITTIKDAVAYLEHRNYECAAAIKQIKKLIGE